MIDTIKKYMILMIGILIVISGCSPSKVQADPKKKDVKIKKQVTKVLKESNKVYISASKLYVRKEPDRQSPSIGSLLKTCGVVILEEKKNASHEIWYKIHLSQNHLEKTGWILSDYTVKDRTTLLSEDLKKLDYSPIEKLEYKNNPKRKVRGIYVTIHSAAGERLNDLLKMVQTSSINTLIIDVKDDQGSMLFKTLAAEKYSKEANKSATIKDIHVFMKKLKEQNIYTIARIVSFKDPTYTKAHPDRAIVYKDTGKIFCKSDGLFWATPHDQELWKYNIAVAKEAAKVGFNEIQLDYVRFPASNGGKLDEILDYRNKEKENKSQTIQNYLKYAHEELSKEHVYLSADVYGLVGSVPDDMGLGQYWEGMSNVVDYICPMMYPSHYGKGTYGLDLPDAYPYATVSYAMEDMMSRNKNLDTPARIRPWIQDFTAKWVKGHIPYGVKEVKDQIKAMKEKGIEEYMLWNPSNRYTKDAVKE